MHYDLFNESKTSDGGATHGEKVTISVHHECVMCVEVWY